MEFTFTLKYQLDPSDNDLIALVERLGASGCDDAIVGTGQPGRVALEFIREAPSALEAMASALSDVSNAIPTARLIEAAPDLVGVTDVAEMTGVSRQNIRKLLIKHVQSAPVPVHAGVSSLWHLADVLPWLQQLVGYQYPAAVVEVARVAEQINIRKEAARVDHNVGAFLSASA
ncbi:helix-turn-helix transcriptional regulator [Gemmatimonas sp.]|jgi:hypothetical protein|uniref:helix-turn-helix transcriptional regulator n=1 Tax=Gemmatimonas sp. TaxID=1962908 RepID=UPI0031C2118D|nr:DNA-binding protein [Gemmatimonas sp.]